MKTYVERHDFIDKCRNYYRNNGWMKDEVHLSLENVEVLLAYTPAPNVREVMASAWIPVTERLPQNGAKCLVTRYDYVTKTPFVDLLWFDNDWWDRFNTGDYAVTHWMPMPEPYRGGE